VLRSLPPAGHPLRLRTILGAYLGTAERPERFLPCAAYPGALLAPSGTAALTLTMTALRRARRGDEIVLPAYTCPSVAAAVIKAGLKPVLCDLRPDSFLFDQEALQSCVGPQTAAVVAVHLFGIPESMADLRQLTGQAGAVLIEDATQAFGNAAGAAGDATIFSFGRGKPLSLLHGGAIVINNEKLQEPIRAAHAELPPQRSLPSKAGYLLTLAAYSFLFHPRLYWIPASLPWLKLGETRFSLEMDLAAADSSMMRLGNRLFDSFESIRANRLELARQYRDALSGLQGCLLPGAGLRDKNIALLRYPLLAPDRRSRDRMLSSSRKAGLGLTGMYPAPINRLQGLESYFPGEESFPRAQAIADRLVTMPLHEHVGERDIERMQRLISDAL